jgi:integrase
MMNHAVEYEVSVPDTQVKNGSERLVVLNKVAASVIEEQRGNYSEYVFPYRKRRGTRMHNSAWKHGRNLIEKKYQEVFGRDCPEGLRTVRVHGLKHTFGRHLRGVSVSFVDRQDLLAHKSGRITTHFSAAELQDLTEAANRVCVKKSRNGSPAQSLASSTATATG